MQKYFYFIHLIIILSISSTIAAPNPLQNLNSTNNTLKIIRDGEKLQDNWYSLDQVNTIERVPQGKYFPNTVFVKLRTKAAIAPNKKSIHNSLLQASIANLSIKEIELPYDKYVNSALEKDEFGVGKIYKITYELPVDPYQVCIDLMKNPDVEYATPIFIRETYYTPNDTYFKNGTQYYMDLMQIRKAWDISKGSPDVTIAIIDGATDWTHEDLIDNIWTNPNEVPDNGIDDDQNGYIDDIHGWDFVGNYTFTNPFFQPDNDPKASDPANAHGTHTAGLASATTDNSKGIAGTGFNCKIIPIKVGADTSAVGGILAGYDGILYAANLGADIISCSWGGPGYSPAEEDIINTAIAKGSLIVVASGNESRSLDDTPHYPAAFKNVLTVGSSLGSTLSSFSNYGILTDVYAPGDNIMSSVPDNKYRMESGTSMATPIVAGVAALVKSVHPDWSPSQIAKQIRITCDRIIAKSEAQAPYLYGFVNAFKALQYNNIDTTLLLPGIALLNAIKLNSPSITDYSLNDIRATFTNYLSPAEGVQITLIPEDSWVIIPETTFTLPQIATNDVGDIQFQMQLTDKTPWFEGDTRIIVKIQYKDLVDYDVITIPIDLPTSNYFNVSTTEFRRPGIELANAMTMFDDGSGLIIGNYNPSVLPLGLSLIYKITKNNSIVSPSYIQGDPFYAIYAFDNNHFIIGTGTDDNVGRGTLRTTTNGGSAWTIKDISTITNFINFVHFYDDNNGIFLGDPVGNIWGVAKTSDGGNSWNIINDIPSPLPLEDGLVGSGQIRGSEIWFGTTKGRIFYSGDEGNSWSVQTVSAESLPVLNVSFIDKYRGIAVLHSSLQQTTTDATIMITNDGGQTWTQSQTDVSNNDLYPIYFFNVEGTNNQYMLSISGRVSVSADNGDTFVPVLTRKHESLTLGQYKLSDNRIKLWSVGGSLSYLLFDKITSVYEPIQKSNITISPNPANTFINVTLPPNMTQIKSVYITNIQGEEVLNLSNLNIANNSFKIDLNTINSGTYFIIMSTDTKNYFEKIIISR